MAPRCHSAVHVSSLLYSSFSFICFRLFSCCFAFPHVRSSLSFLSWYCISPGFLYINVLLRRFYLVLSLHTFSFYFIYIIFLCFFLSSAFPDTISLFIIYVGVTFFYGSTFLFLSEIRLFLYNIHRAVDILFRCCITSFNFFFFPFDVSTLLQYNLLTCL